MWMLYDEFIYLLRDLHGRWPWFIDSEHQIRTLAIEGHSFCPITAACATVCQRALDPESYRAGARLLGLDCDSADAVAQAADLAGAYNAHVRADLSDALRLGEQWGQEGRWNDPAFHSSPYPHGYDRPIQCGGISHSFVGPALASASSRCITPPAITPSRKPRFAIIDESARMRSIISGLSAATTASSCTPPPITGPCGCGNCSAANVEYSTAEDCGGRVEPCEREAVLNALPSRLRK